MPPRTRLSEAVIAAIVVLHLIAKLSWTDISTKLRVHPETARQAYQRVYERSQYSQDVRVLLEHCDVQRPGVRSFFHMSTVMGVDWFAGEEGPSRWWKTTSSHRAE